MKSVLCKSQNLENIPFDFQFLDEIYIDQIDIQIKEQILIHRDSPRMKESEVYVGFGKVKWFWSTNFAQEDAVPDKRHCTILAIALDWCMYQRE